MLLRTRFAAEMVFPLFTIEHRQQTIREARKIKAEMRINVELPIASTSNRPSSSVPPPLVQLAPDGELALLELQGRLEMDDVDASGGQILAKLEFLPGREDRPTLLISHHRLEGKVVSLPRPFAVLEKKRRERKSKGREGKERIPEVASSPAPFLEIDDRPRAQRGASCEREEEEEHDASVPLSPTMARKRAWNEADVASLQTPLKLARKADFSVSSSPILPPPMRGSELDFSSPPSSPATQRASAVRARESSELHNTEALEHKRADDIASAGKADTKTYFEVVCVIRKKILFTKRPEPVVRLDEEGGEKARVALGIA